MCDVLSTEKNQLISERFKEITGVINDLKLLIEDNNFYFQNTKNIDEEKVNQLIENIKKNNLNYIKNNKEIEGYKNIITEAKGRIMKRNSKIYMEIYKSEKLKEPNDDYKCLENSNNKFNKLKLFLTHKSSDKIYYNHANKGINYNILALYCNESHCFINLTRCNNLHK